MPPGDLHDLFKLLCDLLFGAFDFHDQERLHHRVARFGEILADLDAKLVHELHRHRQDARLDDVRDTGPRNFARVEAHQHWPRPLGRAQDPQRGFSDDAQLPLGSAEQTQKV